LKNHFYILVLFLLTIACVNQREEKSEITFLNDAVNKAKTVNKILIIEFWAPECGPCIKLKCDIFENDKNLEFLNKYFLLVQVSPVDSLYNPLFKHFKLAYQSSVIYIDSNGNEIDRSVSYDGNKDAYLNLLKEVAEGKNLYKEIFATYKKDTLDAFSNYLLAKKLLSRYQLKDAIKHYNNVLLYDSENRLGLNTECKFKIAESELLLTGNLDKMREYVKTDLKNGHIPKAYIYLINELKSKKDKISCISLCEDAYSKYPDNHEILNKYAWMIFTFKIKEDYKKALTMVQKAISINPNIAGYYSTQAWLYYEIGEKEKAIQLQKKAIELYPHPVYVEDLEKIKSH
jgi:tetratricopeptide (TPR) repeat protein